MTRVGAERKPRLWNVDTGAQVSVLDTEHTSTILDAEYSPDGRYLVSGGVDNAVRLWDTATGTKRRFDRDRGHKDAVFSVAFNTVGDRIISGSSDRSVRIWNLDGELVSDPLKGHDGKVYAAIFRADDNTIMRTGSDRTIRF